MRVAFRSLPALIVIIVAAVAASAQTAGQPGMDDPKNANLLSISRRDWRTRNLALAADVIYKFTPQFSLGAEVRRLQANYFYSGRQSATHVNLGASYTF
jgi:hypothetical protein